ncbi:hypothetical protein [Thermoanaerobacterium thermosaccharolyticum]|uniref:hypothetical protein n=1 Tax=Thermoanaerobacterium thermosaccharolyticum TaxID=1517 RepID=UPI003DA83E41
MKYNQNTKIMQITEKTLIVGVDIAKEIHHARAFCLCYTKSTPVFQLKNPPL